MSPKRPLLEIPVMRPFDFRLMIFSHGWVDLAPFVWDQDRSALTAVIKTCGTRAFGVTVTSAHTSARGQSLLVEKVAGKRPGKKDLEILKKKIAWMFRLDEDFGPFQRRCARTRGLTWIRRLGLGALLRNSDLFEEFVKVLLTTNVNWAGTQSMNAKLLHHFGVSIEGARGAAASLRAFPGPEAIAASTETALRQKVRVGYRAPFLLALARAVASGALDLDRFVSSDLDSDQLAIELGRLKGFGPYAVNALLLTLGRYDRLILDSWIRKKTAERYFDGKKVADSAINEVYAPWGEWKTLACWFECAYDTWFKDELNKGGQRTKV